STSWTVCASCARVRAARTSFAPSRAYARAMALPMPRPAPVMMATRLSSCPIVHLSLQHNLATSAACDATQRRLLVVGHGQHCHASIRHTPARGALTLRPLLGACRTTAHPPTLFPHSRQRSMVTQLTLSEKLSPVYGPYSSCTGLR